MGQEFPPSAFPCPPWQLKHVARTEALGLWRTHLVEILVWCQITKPQKKNPHQEGQRFVWSQFGFLDHTQTKSPRFRPRARLPESLASPRKQASRNVLGLWDQERCSWTWAGSVSVLSSAFSMLCAEFRPFSKKQSIIYYSEVSTASFTSFFVHLL